MIQILAQSYFTATRMRRHPLGARVHAPSPKQEAKK